MNIESCNINNHSNSNSVINIKFIANKQTEMTSFFQSKSKEMNLSQSSDISNSMNFTNIEPPEKFDIKNVIARYTQKENISVDDSHSPLKKNLILMKEKQKEETIFVNPMSAGNNNIQSILHINSETKPTVPISMQSIFKDKEVLNLKEPDETTKKDKDILNKSFSHNIISNNSLITNLFSKKLDNHSEFINPSENIKLIEIQIVYFEQNIQLISVQDSSKQYIMQPALGKAENDDVKKLFEGNM